MSICIRQHACGTDNNENCEVSSRHSPLATRDFQNRGVMEDQLVIMLQIVGRAWTIEALHAACALACRVSARIVLSQMVPVHQPGFLGTELGYLEFSQKDRDNLKRYVATIADYGVAYSLYLFQYYDLARAIAETAERVGASVVFATLPAKHCPVLEGHPACDTAMALLGRGRCELILEPGTCLQPRAGRGSCRAPLRATNEECNR